MFVRNQSSSYWGRNAAGELGDGTEELRTEPTPVTGDLEFKNNSSRVPVEVVGQK